MFLQHKLKIGCLIKGEDRLSHSKGHLQHEYIYTGYVSVKQFTHEKESRSEVRLRSIVSRWLLEFLDTFLQAHRMSISLSKFLRRLKDFRRTTKIPRLDIAVRFLKENKLELVSIDEWMREEESQKIWTPFL